ncbi:ejaculatory bulb-specific protein 3 [Cimex lectularius]|uniref:Chemosensory protein n=1 Tax=Cimex lectularius TaxID=79782 RepID=A0A8I6RCV6_CIMLE|nr:ejaculatory bulb-specific protein 3 [Cimex lectularius]
MPTLVHQCRMKSATLLIWLLACATSSTQYTTKYDNIDVEVIMKNQRLYRKYFDCLTDRGRCTPDAKELKDSLPDALATGCSHCTERQRVGSEKVIKYLLDKRPADFAVLERIFDPKGLFKSKFEDEAKRLGIPV